MSTAIWPAFIWNILKNEMAQADYGEELWQLVPQQWRQWWFLEARQLPCLSNITLMDPPPHLNKISASFREMSNALRGLEWIPLSQAIDKHLQIPSVKCPWGCCQFLNLATEFVPLDIIYLDFLNQPCGVLQMKAGQRKDFLDGVRPNFLRSKHPILDPDWGYCSPSILFKETKGPVIATCGHHSVRSKGQYLHVPRNPFGTTMTNASDQFAPAVVKPRTITSVQRRAYSDNFNVSCMHGSYEGINTLNVCNRGDYSKCDTLSMKQDSLAIACRPDIAAHVGHLGLDGVVSQSLVDIKQQRALRQFPSEHIAELRSEYRKDTTYFPLDKALNLETYLKHNSDMTCTVYDAETGDARDVQYTPSWPSSIIYVQRSDNYGSPPYSIPAMCSRQHAVDTNYVWLAMVLVVHNSHIWSEVQRHVVDNNNWPGWLLAFVASHVIPNSTKYRSRNDPFRSRVNIDLLTAKFVLPGVNRAAFNAPALLEMFAQHLDGIQRLNSCDFVAAHASGTLNQSLHLDTRILLVSEAQILSQFLQPSALLPSTFQLAGTNGSIWELRQLALVDDAKKRTLFVRHGEEHLYWWQQCQTPKGSVTVRKAGQQLPYETITASTYTAIYTRLQNDTNQIARYLELSGGQARVQRGTCNKFLITSSSRRMKNTICSTCGNKKTVYECPMSYCPVGYCKEHWEQVYTNNNTTDSVHFVFPFSVDTASMNDDDDSSYCTTSDDDSTASSLSDYSAESSGPVLDAADCYTATSPNGYDWFEENLIDPNEVAELKTDMALHMFPDSTEIVTEQFITNVADGTNYAGELDDADRVSNVEDDNATFSFHDNYANDNDADGDRGATCSSNSYTSTARRKCLRL